VASVARAGAEGDPAADACVPEDVVPGIELFLFFNPF
jgi:hypothetical protein